MTSGAVVHGAGRLACDQGELRLQAGATRQKEKKMSELHSLYAAVVAAVIQGVEP